MEVSHNGKSYTATTAVIKAIPVVSKLIKVVQTIFLAMIRPDVYVWASR
jgi:hypothetical protein